MEENEKTCRNCKEYVAHYIRNFSKFSKLDCGHCGYRYKHRKKVSEDNAACLHWIESTPDRKEKFRSLKAELLYSMHRVKEAAEVIDYLNRELNGETPKCFDSEEDIE